MNKKYYDMEEKLFSTNYSVAVHWCNNHYILCNSIPEIDPSVYENIMMPAMDENIDEADERDFPEIFQWFLADCSNSDVKYLMETFPGVFFTYSDVLGLYVLCVNHYGTSWDYVGWSTTNEYAQAKLGQKKEDL